MSSILNRCIPKKEKHILTLPYDGWFEKSLCKTGYTFYGDVAAASIPWNPNNLVLPDNFVIFNNNVPEHVDFDCIIINDIYKHIEKAYQISCILHIPIVNVNHYNASFFKAEDLEKIRNEYRKIYANIAISENVCLSWQSGGEMIAYGVELPEEKAKTDSVLLLGQYTQKDYQIIKEICDGVPNLVIIGDNPGLSRGGTIDDENIALDHSKIYVNMLTYGRSSINLYRAMAAGCVVVSNITPETQELVIDGFNGFLAQSTDDFRLAINKVLKDPKLADRVRDNARNTIASDFTTQSFVEKWNRVIDFSSRQVFKR